MLNRMTKKAALSLMLAALVAAGCDSKPESAAGDTQSAAEVAAKVNGTELPAAQVDLLAKRLANSETDVQEAVRLQAARNLVDQEVAAQKAVADKLDKDPAVAQTLEMARRQILAEAYLNRKLGTSTAPSDAEISAYFDAHPELFAKRKIYRLQELSIQADPSRHDAIRAQLAASRTLNEFAEWLKRENLAVQAREGVKPAEQIPMELLPRLAQMPDGQALIVNAPDGLLVIVLADSQMQPATLEQAKPAIARMLQTLARQKAAKTELDTLKAAAKIEYLGKFVDAGKQDAAEAGATTAPQDDASNPGSPAPAEATPVAPKPAEPAADAVKSK